MSRVAKRTIDTVTLIFLSGAGLLGFFVILCGAKQTGFLEKFWWMRVDTSSLTPEVGRGETYWLNYMYCTKNDSSDDHYSYCSSKKPAYPFSPKWNFGDVENLPSDFSDSKGKFYYLSRVGWSMWAAGLFFLVLSLLPYILQACVKHTLIFVASTMCIWAAWFYLALGAALWTSAFVMGKNAFDDAGMHAKLSIKMFAFLWTTVFLISVCALWEPISAILSKKHSNDVKKQNSEFQQQVYSKDLEHGDKNVDYSSETDSYMNGQAKYSQQGDFSDFDTTDKATTQPETPTKTNLFGFQKKVKRTTIYADGEKKTDVTHTAGILNVPFHKGSDSAIDYNNFQNVDGNVYGEHVVDGSNYPNDGYAVSKANVPTGIATK